MTNSTQSQAAEASTVPTTFSGEGILPRVPLPDLADTMQKFEQWCAPLLTQDELEETRVAMAEFGGANGPGQRLHEEIAAYDQQAGVHSWLDEFWPARYLGRRVPVSINANFIFSFIEKPLTQVQRAAQLLGGGARYKQLLDQELVPPATQRGTPMCMEQHKFLFSTTRIPGEVRDTVRAPYSANAPGPSPARHVLVACKHQLFSVDVIAADGRAHSVNELETALQAIIDTVPATALAQRESVGYLTTLPRSDWAPVRKTLLSVDEQNPVCMEAIEQALFCLCLDDAEPENLCDTADQLLHGDGGNRWFDKSVSLIVFANGASGINCEHCGVDGGALIEFVDFLHSEKTCEALEAARHDFVDAPVVNALAFTLNESLRRHIEEASQAFDDLASRTATTHTSFDDFGAAKIKTLKMSPDAFAQIGFQLAHLRTKGLVGATYESIATRQYDRGRTEAMRVVTPEIVAFVNAMEDAHIDEATTYQLLRDAAAQHSQRLRECQVGGAPEQHLWQLQLLAEERGAALGTGTEFRLFSSPGWLKMRNDYLSTSSAPSENITVFGFGATSEQCIGVAYLVRRDSIKAYLSTPSAVEEHMLTFADNLHTAFRDMAALLQGVANE
jgi:carnitine O-acetyltransferase